MPRNRGGSSRPSRPMAAPTRPTAPAPAPRAPQQQQRPNATYAPASAAQQQQQQKPQQGAASGQSFIGQVASTAAGVAMGSMLANSLSGVFGGGTNQPAEDQQRYQAPTQPEQNGGNLTAQQQQQWGPNCQFATKDFTRCLDEQAGNMQICGWYLEQLKLCQKAAGQY